MPYVIRQTGTDFWLMHMAYGGEHNYALWTACASHPAVWRFRRRQEADMWRVRAERVSGRVCEVVWVKER